MGTDSQIFSVNIDIDRQGKLDTVISPLIAKRLGIPASKMNRSLAVRYLVDLGEAMLQADAALKDFQVVGQILDRLNRLKEQT